MNTAMRNRMPRPGRTVHGLMIGAFALICGTAAAQDEADSEAPEAASDEEVDEVVVVTGTRLQGGDPTARVDVITAEDIAAQGLTSFEDVVRSIPQNFATINSANNLVFGDTSLDANLGALGLGNATANLRGFGTKHTLVLLDGMRLAGISSSSSQLGVNLNDIPVAAIDRIEVSFDGGSAVYGSDAVGGVINIITKRDYSGVTFGGKYENSSTGGHRRSANVLASRGWGTGSVSAIVSMSQSDPIATAKTGWTTNDHSSKYGGDQDYNFIGTSYARSGTVALSRWGTASLILPPGNDGRNAQPDDFVAPQASDYLDIIPNDIGGEMEQRSVLVKARQNLGGREQIELYADLLYTVTDTASQVSTFGFSAIQVPASNAFNNFGHDVFVNYYANTEADLGLLPQVEQRDQQQQLRYRLRASYEFNDRFRAELDFVNSASQSEGDQYMFAPPSTRQDDAARFARLTELIASSDPATALNLFGDGTGQNPTVAEFYRSFANDRDDTFSRKIEPKFHGKVWDLPGGPIGFVVGSEIRKNWVETPGDDFTESYIGTSRPTQNLTAYFLEASAPIVGDANARPFLRRLALSTQVRYDEYRVEGALSVDENDRPVLTESKYSNTVSRIGAAWGPSDTVTVRASRAEAFKTPSVSSLYGGTQRSLESNFVYDPLATPPFVPAKQSFGPNPNLRPESSTNWTVGLEWKSQTFPSLEIKVDWSRIDLQDRIASRFELSNLLPVEVYGNLKEFFVRDESGKLIESISRPINISARVDERLDLEARFSIETSFGTLRPVLTYHRVLDRFDQPTPEADKFRHIGKSVGVDKYKLRANVGWLYGPLTADLWIRHDPGYINNDHEASFRQLPNEPVGSLTTIDLTVGYEFDNGMLIRAGGRNLLDRNFPYMLSRNRAPYDRRRVELRKRVLFLEMSYSLWED